MNKPNIVGDLTMNLCQVVPYVTYPPRLGGDHRSHGLVTKFPDHGDTVERFCQGGSPAMYKSRDFRRRVEISDGYTEYRHLHPLHELVKAPMLAGYPNVFASNALHLTSDNLNGMLDRADVVLVREPWQMPYILDCTPDSTPIVFSSHNVETERFGNIDQPLFEAWTKRQVAQLERCAVKKTDAIVCTSKRDADVYRDTYNPRGPILIAPNGTYEADLRAHEPNSDAAQRIRREQGIPDDATVCLFMGSDYRPNVEAACAAVNVAREMTRCNPPMYLLVLGSVGKSIPSHETPPNVTVTGYVKEDFEAYLDAADIALNPMQSGGGTNIKLIDYFARSLPVISTPFGARGVDITDGKNIVLAELPDFPEAIKALRADPERRRQIGRAGHKLATERYTWEAASQHVRNQVQDLFGPF